MKIGRFEPTSQTRSTCGLDAEGCRPVAAWEDGHGQVDISILQLSPLLSGPPALVRVNAWPHDGGPPPPEGDDGPQTAQESENSL
ncbi:hypothetical protein ACH4E8_12265 [Streptomyces sp. NPDC017979]|uniref:hypothetical protein n=1 Tax=Streptomyces sp. NPDC017979 TaxID=3365024 RepID=UPI0037934474